MNSSSSGRLQRSGSSTPHYQAFPNTKPPPSRGKPPIANLSSENDESIDRSNSYGSHTSRHESPLPTRQLAVLAIIALAEQTALNSISPYLPDMASHFPGVAEDQVGLFVGLIASAFALAQFATNFFWGWVSDKLGRKPVILLGTVLTAACFMAFGFCKTLWQAIVVQALMGLVNGNQGVVSTCLGEITDKSNQSKAFKYLPVVYGIGGITGPAVGGLLVKNNAAMTSASKAFSKYPYLPPNLLSAAILVVDFVIAAIFLEESLEEARELAPLPRRVGSLFSWLWQFSGGSHRPTYARPTSSQSEEQALLGDDDYDSDDDMQSSMPTLVPQISGGHTPLRDAMNRDTVLILATFLIFQLSNIAYNSLYPIFAEASPPTGRNLLPSEIGVSLAFAGLVTVIFQLGFFNMLKEKIGNKATYRIGLIGFVIAFILMPFVGYKDPDNEMAKVWLWIELGGILIIKTVASVGGLTSALLLITNSAPDHSVLGALNGLAQTLSAGGRAIGPFISGAVFTAATHVRPKGEALAFGLFAGISFVGFLMSFGIRGEKLECDNEGEDEDDSEDDDDEEHELALSSPVKQRNGNP